MRWHTLAMTALVVLLAGAMAFAQDGPAGGPRGGAQGGGPRGDRMGQGQRGQGAQGGGLLEILNQLNLTDEQKQKLDQVKADFDRKVAEAREKGGNPRDIYQGYVEEVKAVLNEEQLKKFNELNQQRGGGMGGPGGRQPGAMIALALLGVAPQGMMDLNLTPEQQTKVQAIVKEFTDEVKKLQEKYQGQIRETLTPEQQTKFDKAVEEMKNRMGPGGMGGGPGGDRPQRPDRGNRPDRPARDGGAPQPPPKPEDKPAE